MAEQLNLAELYYTFDGSSVRDIHFIQSFFMETSPSWWFGWCRLIDSSPWLLDLTLISLFLYGVIRKCVNAKNSRYVRVFTGSTMHSLDSSLYHNENYTFQSIFFTSLSSFFPILPPSISGSFLSSHREDIPNSSIYVCPNVCHLVSERFKLYKYFDEK